MKNSYTTSIGSIEDLEKVKNGTLLIGYRDGKATVFGIKCGQEKLNDLMASIDLKNTFIIYGNDFLDFRAKYRDLFKPLKYRVSDSEHKLQYRNFKKQYYSLLKSINETVKKELAHGYLILS